MPKKNIKISIAALAALALISGGLASTVLAAEGTSVSTVANRIFGNRQKEKPAELTEAQKAEMQAKQDAVKAALNSGSYDAWVTAVKAMDENSPLLTKVTAENFSEYVAQAQQREANMEAQKIKIDAVQTALNSGSYDAWVTAVEALNENSPLLEKINSSNFSRYLEANTLRAQADSILKELGIDGRDGLGSIGMPGGEFGHGGPGEPRGQNNTSQNN